MRKRRAIAVAIVLATVALAVAFLLLREPLYKGLTMGQWLKRLDYAQANEAILILGTNNLRFYTKQLAYDAQKDPIYWVVNKIPIKRKYDDCIDRFILRRADSTHDAQMAFERLGTNAAPALPQLARVVRQGGWPAQEALTAASYLGPEGIKFLGIQLTNATPRIRLSAVNLLGGHLENHGPSSRLVRTILTNAIRNCATDVQQEASNFLAEYYDHQRPPYLPDKEDK